MVKLNSNLAKLSIHKDLRFDKKRLPCFLRGSDVFEVEYADDRAYI